MAMDARSLWVLAGLVLVTFGASALGTVFTMPAVGGWYATLAKPAWNPPSWVFGPVWTLLYALMAVAAWLVWRKTGWSGPLVWWAAQLTLNAAWSPLFFGLHRIDLALVDIVLLWVAIAGTMMAFWKVTPLAGWLLVPYLTWVSFATALNFTLWRLNR